MNSYFNGIADSNTNICSSILTVFNNAIIDYHVKDNVNSIIQNPYKADGIQALLYLKCWIDTVQWHLEDEIRNPHIDASYGLTLKRQIDMSNQRRTDIVEQIDDYFFNLYERLSPLPSAPINTESPAWAIDRLSILCLKIYHMRIEVERVTDLPNHVDQCRYKLSILLEQQEDLLTSIHDLLDDIATGKKYMKVYRQMKMYNDPNLNPVFYRLEKKGV